MIEGAIEVYLDSVGGKPSAGVNWVLECPFCNRKGHLYCTVSETEGWDGKPKPAGVWICFGCGEKSRDFSRLLAEIDGVTLSEARATIGQWKLGGVKLRSPASQRIKQAPESDAPWLPPEYEPIGGPNDIWPKYLTTRNITKQTALAFKLGVCRRHDKCEKCKPFGGCPHNMARRIILPIECPAGRSFQARAIPDKMEPRYLSGSDSGQLLFGWHTIEDADFAVIVEGPFDTLAMFQAGFPSSALMGKDIRSTQVEMLRMRRRRYVIALDPMSKDPTAIDSACHSADLLGGLVAIMPRTDPGASTADEIVSAVGGAVEPLDARQLALRVRLDQLAKRSKR